MKVLGIEEFADFKCYKLKDDNKNEYIAEQLFVNKKPKSRIVANIKKNIEKIINERKNLFEHSSYIHYKKLAQINGEYCLLRKGTEIYKPLYQYVKDKEISLEEVVEWITTIGEIAAEAEEYNIKWHSITMNSLWISGDKKLKFVDPDISNELLRYRELQGIEPIEIYQAPEIFKDISWNQQSVIYSVGIIFYYLLTEEMPFTLADKSDYSKSDLVHEIINTSPLKPSYLNPHIGVSLNDFVMESISKEREGRIKDWQIFLKRLNNIGETGRIYASRDEEEEYRVRAEKVIRVSSRKRSIAKFWRKRRKIIVVSFSIILLLYIVNMLTATDPYINEETSPQQVVDFFYQAVNDKNTILLNETTIVDLKRLDNMVAETHVIEKMRSAYDMADESEENKVFGLYDLQISLLDEGEQVSFGVDYMFFYHMVEELDTDKLDFYNDDTNSELDNGIETMQLYRYDINMSDILYLENIDGIWRIVDLEGSIVSIIEGRLTDLID